MVSCRIMHEIGFVASIISAITLRAGAPAGGALVFAQLTVANAAYAAGGRASAALQGRSVRTQDPFRISPDWGEAGTGAVTWQW